MPHLASLLLAIILTGYFLLHITDAAPAAPPPLQGFHLLTQVSDGVA